MFQILDNYLSSYRLLEEVSMKNHGCLWYLFVFPFMLPFYLMRFIIKMIVCLVFESIRIVFCFFSSLISSIYNSLLSIGKSQSAIPGLKYEDFCARYLNSHGYYGAKTTKASGDQGVNVIAYKRGKNMLFNVSTILRQFQIMQYKK